MGLRSGIVRWKENNMTQMNRGELQQQRRGGGRPVCGLIQVACGTAANPGWIEWHELERRRRRRRRRSICEITSRRINDRRRRLRPDVIRVRCLPRRHSATEYDVRMHVILRHPVACASFT